MRGRYLIRFDDICPGMNWPMWREIEKVLLDSDIKPILAVVPSNGPDLDVGPPEKDFWSLVRGWQARGWTVGLHGYQHRYVTNDAGLVGLNDRSEFAGLPVAQQEAKLTRALEIFRSHAVRADVWIAPAHSFDRGTISVLKRLGVTTISDGFFLSVHRDRDGMIWIPQQLWSLRYRPWGLWTVCYHHNGWTASDLRRFAADVAVYRTRVTSVDAVIGNVPVRRKAFIDDLASAVLLGTYRSKRWVRRRFA